MQKLKGLAFFLLLFCFFPKKVFAQEEILEGKVVAIIKEDVVREAGQMSLYQELEVLITKGSLTGRKVFLKAGGLAVTGKSKYKISDGVLVSFSHDFEGNEVFNVSDFIRRKYLLWPVLIFVVLVTAIGRWQGISSLLGLAISFLVIFFIILPQIDAGRDPVLVAIAGSLLIMPLTFYFSHGLNRKTTIAIASTLIALILTGLLAKVFVQAARLTGFASEEAGFLQMAKQGSLNIRGLILAGIIIGALGILDDITVSQAAIVQQLKQANPRISKKELFARAMKIGQDHIASMVNTLVLVYTGAALPLLLLFVNNPLPFSQVVNYEIIAEEIIRTLAGSIGLITAVPITTFLGVKFSRRLKS